jgi:hypothetical protein
MFGLSNRSQNTVEKKVMKTVKLVRETGSAVLMDKVEQKGGSILRQKSEAAGAALAKKGLHGIRAEALCVLDYSGSMHGDYSSGAVQQLTERFLAFALQIDGDGTIPVIPFASRRLPTVDVTLDNFQGVVEREIVRKHGMGSTNLSHALEEVLSIARTTDSPLFVGIVTDGSPDSREDTTRLVCELANYPVFIKFMALGSVPYLQDLDDLDDSKRLLDNVDTKTFTNLNMSDSEFADAMADEWDSWVKLATQAGILTN